LYASWRARVAGTSKSSFLELPKTEKEALLNALIREQGGLCAYTMRRINNVLSHVEHIKPQTVCRIEAAGSDLDYDNLVACYPRENLEKKYSYGAQKKGDWWDNGGVDFVSPLHPSCEKRFRFDLNGEITPVRNAHSAATTIRILRLDHPSLTEIRRRATREFIYGSSGTDPLSSKSATTAAGAICNRSEQNGFTEFCVAIRHALEDHLSALQKQATRRKFARRKR